jgi:hypothetical protein
MLATANTVTLTRAQGYGLLSRLGMSIDTEVFGPLRTNPDRDDFSHMERFLRALIYVKDAISWDPELDSDSYEIEVTDDVVWLAREVIGPDASEENRNMDVSPVLEDIVLDLAGKTVTGGDLARARAKLNRDALAAVELIGSAA